MALERKDLLAVWNQKEIPVIHRPGGAKPIRIRVPYAPDNRQW